MLSLIVLFQTDLGTLGKHGMYVKNGTDKLCLPNFRIEDPLKKKNGHASFEWHKDFKFFVTREELIKPYRAFSDLGDRFLNLLCLARPSEFETESKETLTDIALHRRNCHHFGSAPWRLEAYVTSRKDLFFGDEISDDLMFLSGKAVLPNVGTATWFLAATFSSAHRNILV